MPIYGSVWSKEAIEADLPKVPKHLLPWLLKDRREAEVGAMVKSTSNDGKTELTHNKEGLEYAERELRRIKNDIAGEKPDSQRAIILSRQAEGMAERIEFWRGKMYLLDRVIEETRKNES